MELVFHEKELVFLVLMKTKKMMKTSMVPVSHEKGLVFLVLMKTKMMSMELVFPVLLKEKACLNLKSLMNYYAKDLAGSKTNSMNCMKEMV
jgi:hypothetical protein